MKLAELKRMVIMPFSNIRRKMALYQNTMTPEEIMALQKLFHDKYLDANRRGKREEEREYMFKRDILRRVLRIDGAA